MKEHVLVGFATGFVSHFEYEPPEPWGHVKNYPLVTTPQGETKLRTVMSEQVIAGKMIGGKGWTAQDVQYFFGGREFYGIPCNATEKGGDPLGRIVHDYGYYPRGSYSVNAAHSCTSVQYLSAKEVAEILDGVI